MANSRWNVMRTSLLGASIVLCGWCGPAQAAGCGVTGSATASTANYDPFNPAGLATTTVTLNLTRINPPGIGMTTRVNFYLKGNDASADGTVIVPISVSGPIQALGTGRNVFINTSAAPPTIAPTVMTPSATNPFLQLDFTGGTGADSATVTFQVSLPPAANFTASTTLGFNAWFACKATGGKLATFDPTATFEQTGTLDNALAFPITVLSALQASYAGSALDFGEVGGLSVAQGQTGPTTPAGNYVRVQSSGPYAVTLASQNAFHLLHPSGAVTDPATTIRYRVRFLGAERDSGTSALPGSIALNQTCARAGVGAAFEDHLPVSATLAEGGMGKAPSPHYTDILTVTVTPLAAQDVAPTACETL
ncbi:hypothetical protein [Novosphingobium sp.]|uniref:hypothetical protein n=1 Tax=Novosphingobium sp. TaxID=1874826 RepID=UPI0025D98E70|nr:hypothetical protein [Novosphingobium sp.]